MTCTIRHRHQSCSRTWHRQTSNSRLHERGHLTIFEIADNAHRSKVLRRRVALVPVPELSVVFVARLVEDHVVGDVLLARLLHRLSHQDVRLHFQASRGASGWILRHERLMLLPPTCHVGFLVLDVLGGQRFVCSRLPLACTHCVEAGVHV